MQSVPIIILPAAQIDLDEIWITIAQTDFVRADRFVAKLESKINGLSRFPESGVDRADLFNSTRMLVEGNYLIFYQYDGHHVNVMRIVHGARDLNDLDLF